MKKIGFIGLGVMGKPMAINLLKASFSVFCYDLNPRAVQEVAAAGANPAKSVKEVAERCDLIITMLPNSPQVKEVALGENGILDHAKTGSILIDMSSIDPIASQEISAKLAKKGIKMLDAPVSGGEQGAIDGTLSIMVGGPREVFEQVYPTLQSMGKSIVLVGEIGSGNITKLANQIIVALNVAGMSEAMVLATKAGVDPEKVYQAIRGGLAGSAVLDAKVPMVLNRNFKPGFRIELHSKDLTNALNAAHMVGVPLPLTSQVLEMMEALKIDGKATDDDGGLIQFYEKMAQIVVKKGD